MIEDKMRKLLIQKFGVKCLVTRLETSKAPTVTGFKVYSLGVPDLHVRSVSADCFIELKQLKDFPKREATPIKLRHQPYQVRWIQSYLNYNGHVMLCLTVGNKWFFVYGTRIKFSFLNKRDLYDSSFFIGDLKDIPVTFFEASNLDRLRKSIYN